MNVHFGIPENLDFILMLSCPFSKFSTADTNSWGKVVLHCKLHRVVDSLGNNHSQLPLLTVPQHTDMNVFPALLRTAEVPLPCRCPTLALALVPSLRTMPRPCCGSHPLWNAAGSGSSAGGRAPGLPQPDSQVPPGWTRALENSGHAARARPFLASASLLGLRLASRASWLGLGNRRVAVPCFCSQGP